VQVLATFAELDDTKELLIAMVVPMLAIFQLAIKPASDAKPMSLLLSIAPDAFRMLLSVKMEPMGMSHTVNVIFASQDTFQM